MFQNTTDALDGPGVAAAEFCLHDEGVAIQTNLCRYAPGLVVCQLRFEILLATGLKFDHLSQARAKH
ncbi:hypothetical protein D3C75_656160 [compost metagenome]